MFIELHDADGLVLVNTQNISFIEKDVDGSNISFNGECYGVNESYEEVKDLIKMAAGVISKEEE